MAKSPEVNIKPLAFIVAVVVSQAVGMLWYSPMLFQGEWLKALGRSADSFAKDVAADAVKNLYLPTAVGFLCAAMALYVLVHFLTFIKGGLTREGAISISFWGWLAFSALPGFSGVGWERSSINLFLIVQAARLLTMTVSAITYVELDQVKASKKTAAQPAAVDSPAKSPRATRARSRSPRSTKKRN